MKKLMLLLFIFTSMGNYVSGTAIDRITTTSLRFYNFSLSSYDLTNRVISVNSNWYSLSSLSVLSGSLNVASYQSVEVAVTVPNGTGSVGLWQAGTTGGNASAANLIDYVQYGAGGQAYESIAVQAYLTAAGVYAPGTLPIRRTDANTGPGNGNWTQDVTAITSLSNPTAVAIGPNPFCNTINVSTGSGYHSAPAFQCSIYDLTGRLQMQQLVTGDNTAVNTTALPSGAYVVQLSTPEGKPVSALRMVKQD